MARSFNGSSDYITHTGFTVSAGQKVALSCWLKTNTDGGFVLGTRNSNNASGWLSLRTSGGKASMVYDFFGSGFFVDGTSDVANDAWHHLCAYYDGSKLHIYVDGALEASTAGTYPSAVLTYTGGWAMMRRPDNNSEYTGGLLAEVAMWKGIDMVNIIPSLAKGFSPAFFKQGIENDYPLIGRTSPEVELRNGRNGTLVGTPPSAADHPRIYYPANYQLASFSAGGITTVVQDIMGMGFVPFAR